jgi:hypothetical protein
MNLIELIEYRTLIVAAERLKENGANDLLWGGI